MHLDSYLLNDIISKKLIDPLKHKIINIKNAANLILDLISLIAIFPLISWDKKE